jgi:pimeloyl-ACP methyl ester carboxylesterase
MPKFLVCLSLIASAALATASASRADAIKLWAEYVQVTVERAPHGLQEACKPRRFEATAPYVGTVVLFHGFTACPQQFFRMAPVLASNGFDVLLPLNPGHGNALPNSSSTKNQGHCIYGCGPAGTPRDDTTHLPADQKEYAAFVERIADVARAAPGVRVVAGLSLGGGLAAYAGQLPLVKGQPLAVALEDGTNSTLVATSLRGAKKTATEGSPALFERQLIMNPLFELSNTNEDEIARLMNWLPFTHETWIGWGDECRGPGGERSHGRGGLCMFRIEQGTAARDFGSTVLDKAVKPAGAKVAVIVDQADPVVSTSATRDYAAKIGSQDSCVLPFTSHSMLSEYDAMDENKWWLDELSCDVAAFLTEGTAIKISPATGRSEAGDPHCAMACSAESCPWTPTEPAKVPPLQCRSSRDTGGFA